MTAELTVAEAARRIDVNQARVRAMIAAGLLEGKKVGGRWLIDSASVDRRRASTVPVGRPLNVANAWGLLWVAAGLTPDWLSPWALSRVRRRLRDDGIIALVPHLRNRATVRRFRAHPSDVDRIMDQGETVRTGISAAREHGLVLVAPGQAEVYARERDLHRLVDRYALQADPPRPNVVVRIASELWPFEEGCDAAPVAVVGVDLMASDDARTCREGHHLLEQLEARWSI